MVVMVTNNSRAKSCCCSSFIFWDLELEPRAGAAPKLVALARVFCVLFCYVIFSHNHCLVASHFCYVCSMITYLVCCLNNVVPVSDTNGYWLDLVLVRFL